MLYTLLLDAYKRNIVIYLNNIIKRKKPIKIEIFIGFFGSMIFSVVTQTEDNTEYLFLSSK